MSLTAPTTTPPRPVNVADALAADRLGVPAVVFFVMSAATPLTVVAGVVTTGYATTGLTGIPMAFLLVGALLAVFSVGYVAMARRMANAGAFYAYIAHGIGRPVGVGAAWVALLAYNSLQVGLYGAVGAATAPLLGQWLGVVPPWWLIALAGWGLTAILGLARVDVNGTVLAVLLVAEIGIIVLFSLADLINPAGGTFSVETLDPGNLFGPGVGAVLVLAVLGFIGFESAAVFSEESRNPRRTVPTATYLSIGVTAVLYALASWAMTVGAGPNQIVARSRTEGPEIVFNLATSYLGQTTAYIGRVLLVTSIIAAMISFHNTTARYIFALGRERVLPAALGRAAARIGSPRNASLLQSAIGLGVICTYAVGGWNPLVHLFYRAGTIGGLGVLFLITTTAVAVIGYFASRSDEENRWRRRIAPMIAAIALVVVVILAVRNVGTLLGLSPGHPLAWAVPTGYLVLALAGIGWGLILRARKPDIYASVGLGAKSAAGTGLPPAVRLTPARPAITAAEVRR